MPTPAEHLETLRRMLQLTNVIVDPTEMRYRFRTRYYALHWERIAKEVIAEKHLPLKTEIVGLFTGEINLVVRYAPELERICKIKKGVL